MQAIERCGLAILKSWSRPKLTFGGAKAVRTRKNCGLWGLCGLFGLKKSRIGVYPLRPEAQNGNPICWDRGNRQCPAMEANLPPSVGTSVGGYRPRRVVGGSSGDQQVHEGEEA